MLPIAGSNAGAAPAEGSNGSITMVWIRNVLAAVDADERGQGLAEYALILALIAIVSIVALVFLGGEISKIISEIGDSM